MILFASVLSVLWCSDLFARDKKENYGIFQGNLSEPAPRSIKMNYNVNDPPKTFPDSVGGAFVNSPKVPDVKALLHEMIVKAPSR